jgi:hypothetical protein
MRRAANPFLKTIFEITINLLSLFSRHESQTLAFLLVKN